MPRSNGVLAAGWSLFPVSVSSITHSELRMSPSMDNLNLPHRQNPFRQKDWALLARPLLKCSLTVAAMFLTTLSISTAMAITMHASIVSGLTIGTLLLGCWLLCLRSQLDILLVYGEDRYCFVQLRGAATMLRLPILTKTLNRLPIASDVHVDMTGLSRIDHTCIESLMAWAEQHRQSGGNLAVEWGPLQADFRMAASEADRTQVDDNPIHSIAAYRDAA